jgi:hypothetical protein
LWELWSLQLSAKCHLESPSGRHKFAKKLLNIQAFLSAKEPENWKRQVAASSLISSPPYLQTTQRILADHRL